MRIHSVEVAGFGPFLEPQRIDFDAFADHGIFLVQGRTGAGKSSILDAVVYALYNTAPRYRSGGSNHLRSQHCAPDDPTWVELEFTVDGRRHRLRRSPEYERPKARGEGTTTERPKAALWRLEGREWVALESSVRNVAYALDDLLPLKQTQFLQVVMLAQGQFERFLVAESAERKELLGALFDTERFEAFDRVLQRRVSEQGAALARSASAVAAVIDALATHLRVERPADVDEGWLTEVTTACAEEAERAETGRRDAQRALEQIRSRWEELRSVQQRQQRRSELEQRLARLDELQPRVEEARTVLARAQAAAAVVPSLRSTELLTRQREEAARAAAKAAARYEELFGVAVPDELAAQRDALVAEIPAVARAAETEQRLHHEETELARCRSELSRRTDEAQQVARELDARRRVLDRELPTTVEQATVRVHALIDELARARRLEAAQDEVLAAQAKVLTRGEARTAASRDLDVVRRRHAEQSAGRLAESLVPGDPCPVCGGTEHPAPARFDDVPVAEDDVAAAQVALDRAQDACTRAESELAAARARVSALEGARPSAELAVEMEEATRALDEAKVAQAERDRAEGDVVQLTARGQELEVATVTLATRIEAHVASVDRLTAEVEEARGGAESVADRLEGLREQLQVVDEVLDARSALTSAEAEVRAASARLGEELERHGFATVEECHAARKAPQEVTALEERVRDHDQARTVTEAALAEAELQDLPPEPVDLTEVRTALEQATTVQETAAAAAGVARQRQRTAEELVGRVRDAWARDAAEREAFEVLRRLACTVHGEPPNTRRLRLESYVLAVELEQIVLAANRRLAVMSSGRYELLLNDRVATRGNNAGLEVRVLDQHTQETRTPESLSGGEKFLASLSLALGLAEVVSERAGGVTLDTLFIDEGFGSLDAETLDLAMHTLDQLREHGRTVGLISHVEAMKERIPAQLVVERTSGGWSRVRTLV